jgi:hypothetical protein
MARSLPLWVFAFLMSASQAAPPPEEKPAGYLCCNMRTDGSWISDINYDESNKKIIPVGTPLKVTGYGHFRVKVDINGKTQALGNDYSRDLDLLTFAKRYVVEDDPQQKIASFPKNIQDAIASARLTLGMTREQVLMSVGYPVSSENHNLEDKAWRFWVSSFSEFRVKFDGDGRVVDIDGDADAKSRIILE